MILAPILGVVAALFYAFWQASPMAFAFCAGVFLYFLTAFYLLNR